MPTTAAEFEDDSAFERYVLDRATPLIPRSDVQTSVIELGPKGSNSVAAGAGVAMAHIGVVDSTGTTPGGLSVDDIRPLLLGAGWKVIDLLVELGLEQAGVRHNRGANYSIRFKTQQARNGSAPIVPPFDAHPDLWSRLLAVYAATEVLRHSLVHRQLIVNASTGEITGASNAGQPTAATVTTTEQLGICRLAVGAADAVISAVVPTRRLNQLRWVLDSLAALHNQPRYGVAPTTGLIPIVIVRPKVDMSKDHARC